MGSIHYLSKIASSRNLAVTVLTPMDESIKVKAKDIEK